MAGTHTGDGDAQQLKRYWLAGSGRRKWNTWTERYNHLKKYITPPERAKRVTEAGYFEATGRHGGSDLNRVDHGKPPRGKRTGPG